LKGFYMAYNATTGANVAAAIVVPDNTPGYSNQLVLSVSNTTWPSTFQLAPQLVDATGAAVSIGTGLAITSVASATPVPYVLTSVAAPTGPSGLGVAVYTGTITGGASNAYVGRQFAITGFVANGGSNNGFWQCVASTATTLTLQNPIAVAETHAGAAQDETATAVYTGTITGGASNALAGRSFVIAGFVANPTNNGTFFCVASTTTTLTLTNPAALAESHAATAVSQGPFSFVSYGTSAGITGGGAQEYCVTVSATGLLTAVYKGYSDVEVSIPSFGNTLGNVVSTGNIMNGLPVMKAYFVINVGVVA
jgi:hypothetical protein